MKKIIIYKSSTGFTKRYSEWIAEQLQCEVVPLKEISAKKLEEYELVIYGGGFLAGSINGWNKFKEKYSGNVIVFGTGATPPSEKDMIQEARKRNFTEKELEQIPFFYMQSGLNYEKMNPMEKLMMKVFRSMLAKKKDKTADEKVMESMIAHSYDETDPKSIEPLVEYVKKFSCS